MRRRLPGAPPAPWRPWLLLLGFFVLAAAATFGSSAGEYVADNRYDQYASPALRWERSLETWDGTRGIGRVREDFWPGVTLPLAVLRGLGVPVWAAQRLWHSLVLTSLAMGTATCLACFRPRIRSEHVVAGLAAGFGVYSASFLVPSNLSIHVALVPWLVIAVLRGTRSAHPWRWAALAALLLAAPGNVDPPGVAYSLLPVAVTLGYVAGVERSASARAALGWAARTAAVVVPLSAAAVAKTAGASGVFSQRLGETEPPSNAFLVSSWPETFRGAGSWLSYFIGTDGFLKPQTVPYFATAAVVVATVVPAVVGFGYLTASRWRPRLLFGALALAAGVVMVGAYPLTDSPPLGGAFLDLMERVPPAAALRNAYKAGGGLVVGTAVLFGCGVASLHRRLADRPLPLRTAPAVLAVAVLGASSFPFWSTAAGGDGLYPRDRVSGPIPAYWYEAVDWLDGQPGDGRVLVLPSSTRTEYRWGYLGDDLFDATLRRRHAIDTAIPLSGPQAANLLAELTTHAGSPGYRAGTLGPALHRLGIGWVVLRNDLDWAAMARPRPGFYDALRADPDFELVATFGEPGSTTVDPDEEGAAAERDRSLPPVEIYQVTGAPEPLRVEPLRAPLLVAGDGAAWPLLASAGLLAEGGAVRYTGDTDADAAAAALEGGAPLVVTDTNRRRLRVVVGFETDRSATLAAGQDLDREVEELFAVPGAESVVSFGEAAAISVSGPVRGLAGSQPWYRSANAFDGDPRTAWAVNLLDGVVGRMLRIELARPEPVTAVRVLPAFTLGPGTGVTAARLHRSDGPPVEVDLSDGPATVTLDGRPLDWLVLEITAIGGADELPLFGFAEVELEGIDTAEVVEVPTDPWRAAEDDPRLADAIAAAPLWYLFERQVGDGPFPLETTLRRRFEVPDERSFAVEGTIEVRDTTPEELVDAAMAGAVGGYGTERAATPALGWAGLAADGDPATGWVGTARAGSGLTLRMAATPAGVIGLSGRTSAEVGLGEVVVRGGGSETRVAVEVRACESTEGVDPDDIDGLLACEWSAEAPLGADSTTEIEVELASVGGDGLVSVDAVELDGTPLTGSLGSRPPDACVDVGLVIDARPVPVQVLGDPRELLDGTEVDIRGCEPLDLGPGPHELSTGSVGVVNELRLRPPGAGVGRVEETDDGRDPTLEVTRVSQTSVDGVLDAPAGGIVLSGDSYGPGWELVVDGRSLGGPEPLDTQSGWVVGPTAGPVPLELRYRPQRVFSAALVVSGAALMMALALVAVPRRGLRRRGREPGPGAPRRASPTTGGSQ